MAYTDRNFQTKKQMVEYFLTGREVSVYQPGPYGPEVRDGAAVVEGPHFPQPHRFYVKVMVRDGVVVAMNCKGSKMEPRPVTPTGAVEATRGPRVTRDQMQNGHCVGCDETMVHHPDCAFVDCDE